MRTRLSTWMDDHQVALYLGALSVGGAVGLSFPSVVSPAEGAINPALGLLLYATFLAVPFGRTGYALRDWRFLVTVVVVNFLCIPLVVWALTRPFTGDADRALLVGMLFVLLVPCVDYVIVFTGLAGGAADRFARLEVASRRAVVFTAVTRNSLVVLPLVLALPATYDLSPLVVITQTLVELLVMVTMVRLAPGLVR